MSNALTYIKKKKHSLPHCGRTLRVGDVALASLKLLSIIFTSNRRCGWYIGSYPQPMLLLIPPFSTEDEAAASMAALTEALLLSILWWGGVVGVKLVHVVHACTP